MLVPVDFPLFTADCLSFFLADPFSEVPEDRVVLFLSELEELLVEDLEELLPDDWEEEFLVEDLEDERLVFWLFSEEFAKSSGDLLPDKSLLLSAEMPLSARATTCIPVRAMITIATIAVFSIRFISGKF